MEETGASQMEETAEIEREVKTHFDIYTITNELLKTAYEVNASIFQYTHINTSLCGTKFTIALSIGTETEYQKTVDLNNPTSLGIVEDWLIGTILRISP